MKRRVVFINLLILAVVILSAGQDIDAFVLALIDNPGYQEVFADCDIQNGDMNEDDKINSTDISLFIAELILQ